MSYDERAQEPTTEQFDLLEQIQAQEAAPFTPDDYAELADPIGGWDAHDENHPDPFANMFGSFGGDHGW